MLRPRETVHPLDESKTWPEIRDTLRYWRKENVRYINYKQFLLNEDVKETICDISSVSYFTVFPELFGELILIMIYHIMDIMLSSTPICCRCSDMVVELGEYALDHYSSHLGNEKWAVYEQVNKN